MEIRSNLGSKILERLQEWEDKERQLPGFIQFYRELLKMQSEVECRATVRKPSLAPGVVRERLSEGVPLLSFEDFQPDWQDVQKIFEQIALWLVKDSGGPSDEAVALTNISRNPYQLKAILGDWYRGHSVADIPGVEGIEPELLTFVVATALKPFLSAYSRHLLPQVDQELWCRTYCPVCGGKPDFSYLDKERGARWLLCWRCDAEWLFLRLACPCCGTQNQDALSYFTDEEDSSMYRLYVCEQCRTYIKTIDLRRTESAVLLPLERLMTLDMDRKAQDKGYKPGWSTPAVPVRVT